VGGDKEREGGSDREIRGGKHKGSKH